MDIELCENCGRELSDSEGAIIRAETRQGMPLKATIFCDDCLSRLPGRAAEGGEPSLGAPSEQLDLKSLPERHRNALRWFSDRAGMETGWPKPLPDGTLLVCRPKGIYKPAWSQYALSVRESLSRPYPDEEPAPGDGGGWSYRYYQENLDPDARDGEYTNDALLACMRDGVPVGVLRQVSERPRSRYLVLGVARIRGWQDGFFHLESI